jgi:cellobiose phosphorylase
MKFKVYADPDAVAHKAAAIIAAEARNAVVARGQGESVWNGWFFITVLKAFAELAEGRGDAARAVWCRERAEALRAALEAHAWDGAWYRRAYFDDGTPLGSAQNDECRIDSMPQTWAVISGAVDPARAARAMAAVEESLVHPGDRLIQLFDPPFDKGALQPSYIKGYVPGILENGGQYTHAATWVVLVPALEGRGDRALELWNLINPVYHAATPAGAEHYESSPMWFARTFTAPRRTRAAVVGPGIPARAAGCTASPWRRSSGSASPVIRFASSRAFPRAGRAMRSPSATGLRRIGST